MAVNYMNLYCKQPGGFTIFFAMLVASLTMAIGVAIYDIAVREPRLSSIATQSQYSSYAADSGGECALYWDSKFNTVVTTDKDYSAFATSSDYVHGGVALAGQAHCSGVDITTTWVITSSISPKAATTTFALQLPTQSIGLGSISPCVIIEVSKFVPIASVSQYTKIISHGYNSCIGGVPSGVNVVERVYQITY